PLAMQRNCFPKQSGVGCAPHRATPYAAAMTIAKSIHRIVVSLALTGAGASLVGWDVDPAHAASAFAEVSATVLQGATVGVVNVLDVTPPTATPTAPTTISSTRDVGVINGAGAASSTSRSASSARASGTPAASPSTSGGPAVIAISG